ncbi:DNA-binding domain-containing protein [uncultured Shewanella sp.]|uniref:HvfC/BufC N-terminal domain-containing protein n=1 Tax=Shewanella atlantica TaxID=271099 RepID=UPI002608D3D6|nr:DNA-binding domain-containing protein [uncultured Shewanella sp.]
MRLAQWQDSFMEALAPEGCDDEFLSLVNSHESARIEIYRNNTLQALKATLVKAFPICQQIVGESCFARLARDYLDANPMQESNLNHYGDGFSHFLEGVLQANPAFEGLEYLPELAQMEWLLLKSYYAADGLSCYKLVEIAGLNERQQEEVVMVLRPDVFILHSSFPLYEIWLSHQQDSDHIEIDMPQDRYHLCISRDPFKPKVERISRAGFELLAAFGAEETLGEMTEATIDMSAMPEFIAKGWICGFRLREPV